MTNLAFVPQPQERADTPLRSYDDLLELFYASETPRERWRIGAESERFGVDATTGAPLRYDSADGIVGVFEALQSSHGWEPIREAPGRPVIGLRRGPVSLTLEPGAQLELSGAPLDDVHAVYAEMLAHLAELREVSREVNLTWLSVGFHPLARLEDLPQVPKQRYGIMREYLPTRGSGALDMMWRTATVQANFDYSSEQDALRKLRLALRVAPLVNAMTANSPFRERRLCGKKSVRGDVWRRVDPERAGLIPPLWTRERAGYSDYVRWALDAGMILLVRGHRAIANTGQTFRSFLKHGYLGFRPTFADWALHLNTLFPEVRLRRTLEVRCADALPTSLAGAVPALFAGVLYSDRALAQAEDLMARFSYVDLQSARPQLVRDGLGATIAGTPARALAEELVEIAAGGLERRARLSQAGEDERVFLQPLARLVQAGKSPADLLTEGLPPQGERPVSELIARTQA